ncbi:three-helix bundle dimerization domain-containing protein [Mycolicibacterium sp. 050158]|uniref:three-helix bundle dimerization domain-containing protein n=1 Tax=Mycolicibacterium sp. 050158 TaxID=3090602 RepID=UPI0039A50FE5
MANLSEQVALTQLEDRLSSTFVDVPADRIQSAMRNAQARFEHSKIRDFVPLLVERRVRAELANA